MSIQRLTLDSPAFQGVRLKGSPLAGQQAAHSFRRRRLDYALDFSGRTTTPSLYGQGSIDTLKGTGLPPANVMSSNEKSHAAQDAGNRGKKLAGFQSRPHMTTVPRKISRSPGLQQLGTRPSKDLNGGLNNKIVDRSDNFRHAAEDRTSIARKQESKKSDKKQRNRSRQPAILYSMAGLIFVLGLAVAFNGLQVNSHVAAQVETLQNAAAGASAESGTSRIVPSADKPSETTIARHTVAPEAPRYISIPRLNIHARVLSMGLNEKNQLDAPKNIHDAGWYEDSSSPGLPGAMLFDGHSGIGKTNGIFHYAAKLSRGDTIKVERGDGQMFTYSVTSVEVLHVDSVDMSTMITPDEKADEGLNLITCTGRQIPGTTSLDQRVLVRAVRA